MSECPGPNAMAVATAVGGFIGGLFWSKMISPLVRRMDQFLERWLV